MNYRYHVFVYSFSELNFWEARGPNLIFSFQNHGYTKSLEIKYGKWKQTVFSESMIKW